MKFLTSLLSTIFGLILAIGMVAWSSEIFASSFEGGQFDPYKLKPVVLIVLANWTLFFILDWIYRNVHPKMYYTSWADNEAGPGFNLLQSLISSLRSAVLGLAIPTISLGLVVIGIAPFLVVMGLEKSRSIPLLLLLMSVLIVLSILGWIVQWGYHRRVLELMNESSAKSSGKEKKRKPSDTSSGQIQIRLLNEGSAIKLSKRGTEKYNSAVRLQRWIWFRDLVVPLAALLGIFSVAYYFELLDDQGTVLNLVMFWIFFLVLVWIGNRWRMADRTPLRQLRLGFGLWLHALLVAICSPFLFLVELPGRNGKPDEQWNMIPSLGQWVSHLLRSPRLFWIPAILMISLVPILSSAKTPDDVGLGAMAIFVAGILSYEIMYRLLDRIIRSQKRGPNRLVFLRVFGDSRRGQFLFTHLAPRWKGVGSITCIAAPDVSVHQLESDIGFDILFARLRQRFLSRNEAQVIGRHIESNTLGDVREDHCFDDSWMSAVESMFTQNAVIMMDLRGFSPQREGCIYELGVLRDNIPMDSVVFLIDESTDFEFLKSTFIQLWKTVDKNSSNADQHRRGSEKFSQITTFKMSDSKNKSADQITKLLIEACVATEKHHEEHGKTFLKKLIEDLQLLAADADVQIKKVGNRLPGKQILEAGYSCDHDLGYTSFLVSWKLITKEQDLAISAVNESVQFLRAAKSKHSADGVKTDPDWQELRLASRDALKALGKRRSL